MPHIHSIASNVRAAAEYQEYLERMRAVLLAEKEERIRRRSRAQRFASLLDRDQSSGGNSQPRADEGPANDSAGETGATSEADPAAGFGKHYA